MGYVLLKTVLGMHANGLWILATILSTGKVLAYYKDEPAKRTKYDTHCREFYGACFVLEANTGEEVYLWASAGIPKVGLEILCTRVSSSNVLVIRLLCLWANPKYVFEAGPLPLVTWRRAVLPPRSFPGADIKLVKELSQGVKLESLGVEFKASNHT